MTQCIVISNLDVPTAEEVIKIGGHELYTQGFVNKEYVDSVLEREQSFPTGLDTIPVGVAIPHTDSKYVKDSALCFMKLKQPITFQEMSNPDVSIQVQIVIELAISEGASHLEMLSKLMNLISNEEALKRLDKADTEDEIRKELLKAEIV